MFGPGIYFAETVEDARRKAQHVQRGDAVVLQAYVWMGFVLEVPSKRDTLTKEEVYSYGCHSVRGQANRGKEYVVYDYRNVRDVWVHERD
jgi:hypothetical protein